MIRVLFSIYKHLQPLVASFLQTRCSVFSLVWGIEMEGGGRKGLGGWRETIHGSGGRLEIVLSVRMCVQEPHCVPGFDKIRIRGVGMRMRSETAYKEVAGSRRIS